MALVLVRGHPEARPLPWSFAPPSHWRPLLPSSRHRALLHSFHGPLLPSVTAVSPRSAPRTTPGATPPSSPASRRRDVTLTPPSSGRGTAGGERGANRRAGWPAGGGARAEAGARVHLRASAAIAACEVSFPCQLPALSAWVRLGGVGSLAPRGTAASEAGPPEQRDGRRRDGSVSPRPRPWRWEAAGPGRVRSWCRHDAIAGQEGQVGRKAPKAPRVQTGTECPWTVSPPALGGSRSALTNLVTVYRSEWGGDWQGRASRDQTRAIKSAIAAPPLKDFNLLSREASLA